MTNPKMAWIGIHAKFDRDWVTIFGEPANSTGYSWDPQTTARMSNLPTDNQVCGVFVRHHKSFGIEKANCNLKLAYVCETYHTKLFNFADLA